MTKEQIHMANALAACRFTPGSSTKRFARDLIQHPRDKPLAERQAAYLRVAVYRFRRQIPAETVRLCLGPDGLPPPDLTQRPTYHRRYSVEQDENGVPVRMVWQGDEMLDTPPAKHRRPASPDEQREIVQRHNDDLRRRGLLPGPTD